MKKLTARWNGESEGVDEELLKTWEANDPYEEIRGEPVDDWIEYMRYPDGNYKVTMWSGDNVIMTPKEFNEYMSKEKRG